MEKHALGILGVVLAVALIGLITPSFTGHGVYYQGNLVKTVDGMTLDNRHRQSIPERADLNSPNPTFREYNKPRGIGQVVFQDTPRGPVRVSSLGTGGARVVRLQSNLPVEFERIGGDSFVVVKGIRTTEDFLENQGVLVRNGRTFITNGNFVDLVIQ